MSTIAIPDSVRTALARAEHRPCPLCGGERTALLWFRALDAPAAIDAALAPAGAAGWWIVQCTNCSLARVDPLPQEGDLTALYDETYFTRGVFAGAIHAGGMSGHLNLYSSPSRRRAALRWHGRRLAHLESHHGPQRGRLLDVGCGAGYFLDAARHAGWQVKGVELSPAAAGVGRQQLGLDIVEGALTDAALPSASFDVVTLFEVLEHLRRPGAALAEARRILRSGGLLAVQVPNDLQSYRSQVFGRLNYLSAGAGSPSSNGREAGGVSSGYWWIIPPLHLFYFTAATLSRWLLVSGFRPVYVGSRGSLGTDALTLLKAQGRRPGRIATAALRRLPALPDWLLQRNGWHTELLIYAQKREDAG